VKSVNRDSSECKEYFPGKVYKSVEIPLKNIVNPEQFAAYCLAMYPHIYKPYA
jgi:hypothetical protein